VVSFHVPSDGQFSVAVDNSGRITSPRTSITAAGLLLLSFPASPDTIMVFGFLDRTWAERKEHAMLLVGTSSAEHAWSAWSQLLCGGGVA